MKKEIENAILQVSDYALDRKYDVLVSGDTIEAKDAQAARWRKVSRLAHSLREAVKEAEASSTIQV